MGTLRERVDFLSLLVSKGGGDWRKSRPVVFEWRPNAGETPPWKFSVGKKSDFSDARVEYLDSDVHTNAAGIVSYELPRANFEIATRYYWRVTCNLSRKKESHGALCNCKDCLNVKECQVASFFVEDLAPRWIALEGRVGNVRDLGGRKTINGRRVRQGLVFRGQGLNDNSAGGIRSGRNRLMVEDVNYLTKTLKIKTDLDLRSSGETAYATNSPLGNAVCYVQNSSLDYDGIFKREGMEAMARNFRVFCSETNYPVYFHCIAGADRTGALAYVLNGVLGVSRREVETDWESTFYPDIPGGREGPEGIRVWNSEWHLTEGFEKYGTRKDPLSRKIELYLRDCGIKKEEVVRFKSIMIAE